MSSLLDCAPLQTGEPKLEFRERGMVEPINLNRARKTRAKADAGKAAAENRVRFGRTKGEKAVSKLEAEKARRALDQTRREKDD